MKAPSSNTTAPVKTDDSKAERQHHTTQQPEHRHEAGRGGGRCSARLKVKAAALAIG
jgi:hypothetical protein